MRRPVVVTGMGIVSPLGCGVNKVWNRLIAGHSGLSKLPEDVVGGLPSKVGGMVPLLDADADAGFDIDSVTSLKEQKRVDKFILFALAAAEEAIAQAGWQPRSAADRARTATIIASGVGGFSSITKAIRTADTIGPRRLSPFSVPSFLINMASAHVSIRHGFQGPIGAPAAACAASVQAIGDGMRLIQTGEADVVICGGAEAPMDRVSIAGFAAARVLSSGFNENPAGSSRPFDARRDGFVMGEGAGILVIEALDHALARGARPMAQVIGYGATSDAYHITSGPENGQGAEQAMRLALARAQVNPADVQHLNAHATGTIVGDRSELAAIKSVFGHNRKIAVTSTKSSTGHLLGAAGSVEVIFSVMALADQIVPATLNLESPDPASEGVDLVRGNPRPMPVQHVLSNGFGFGGVNASILLKTWH